MTQKKKSQHIVSKDRKSYLKDYYQKNKEKILAYNKKYSKEHRKEETVRRLKYNNSHREKQKEYSKKRNKAYYEQNKEREKERGRKYYWEHLDSVRAYRKKYNQEHRKKARLQWRKKVCEEKYGISFEEYSEMLSAQNGCCAICGKHESKLKKSLCIDHDHNTGTVRGLLCTNCNRAISFFEDNIEIIKKAVEYFRESTDE